MISLFHSDRSRGLHVSFVLAQIITVGYLDYLAGYEVSLDIFYFSPIAHGAWFLGRGWSVAIAISAALTLTLAELAAGRLYSKSWMIWQHGAMRVLVFTFVAYSFSYFRRTIDEARQRARRLDASITFCNCCIRVRTGNGDWGALQDILRETPELAARSTLCPQCARSNSGRALMKGS